MRIVSLAPSNTEILYRLGAGNFIVAVTRYCDFPEEAREKPKVGGWIDVNDELVEDFHPDLVLASTFLQNGIIEREKKKGINILSVLPTTLEEVFESFVRIGQLVEKEKEARELADSIKKEIAGIMKKTDSEIKPRVYIEEWHKPPMVSGNWVPDIVEMAGGEYGLIKSGEPSREISTEEIKNYDPEIIIISICGMGDKIPKEIVTKREGWEDLSAVKNGKVFVFDDSLLNRPGPRLLEGFRKIAEILHPELAG